VLNVDGCFFYKVTPVYSVDFTHGFRTQNDIFTIFYIFKPCPKLLLFSQKSIDLYTFYITDHRIDVIIRS